MKLDLEKDAQKIRRYIEQRICDDPKYENLGPGDFADPIALITVGDSIEQAGSVGSGRLSISPTIAILPRSLRNCCSLMVFPKRGVFF